MEQSNDSMLQIQLYNFEVTANAGPHSQLELPLIDKNESHELLIHRYSSVIQAECPTCHGTAKHALHIFDGFMQPFLYCSCENNENDSTGRFLLYIVFTPIIALLMSVCFIHQFLREHYFGLPFVNIAFITNC
jgi:hypothetical protein